MTTIHYPILAQVSATETLNRSEQMLQAAYKWVGKNGLKFATALITTVLIYLVGAWIAKFIRAMVIRLLHKRGMDQTFSNYLTTDPAPVVVITLLGKINARWNCAPGVRRRNIGTPSSR